jgi:hypothetical protein
VTDTITMLVSERELRLDRLFVVADAVFAKGWAGFREDTFSEGG